MTPAIGSPCWTVTTVNMSGIVHRCGRRRGSTTRTHAASSGLARRWPVRCAIAPRFPPTSSSCERRRRGTNTPCRPHYAEPTGWPAGRGAGCESIRAVCASWPKRRRSTDVIVDVGTTAGHPSRCRALRRAGWTGSLRSRVPRSPAVTATTRRRCRTCRPNGRAVSSGVAGCSTRHTNAPDPARDAETVDLVTHILDIENVGDQIAIRHAE